MPEYCLDTADEWDAVGKFRVPISCANSKISVKFRKKSGDLVECELSMTRVVDECNQEFCGFSIFGCLLMVPDAKMPGPGFIGGRMEHLVEKLGDGGARSP